MARVSTNELFIANQSANYFYQIGRTRSTHHGPPFYISAKSNNISVSHSESLMNTLYYGDNLKILRDDIKDESVADR
jgi:hypothetical protein